MRFNNTHHDVIGYLLWFIRLYRISSIYFGKPVSGTIYFCTFGLFLVGWIVDLFLIASMDREADSKFVAGNYDYTIAWICLTFGGLFGIHRFYLGKWLSGLLYLATGGFFFVGYLYDFWTLNEQVSAANIDSLAY